MEKHYKPNEFGTLIKRSVKTLQKWDREGGLTAFRTPTGRRYYTHTQYLEYIGASSKNENKRKVVIYTRVSNSGQKDDLENQMEFLQQFVNAKGIIVGEVVKDIISGLHYNRKKWNLLLKDVQENNVSEIYISHKDRFIRFGYDWFERFLLSYGIKLIVVNNEKLSPQQDLISIIHVFSCRIYGLRKYKNTIKKDGELD